MLKKSIAWLLTLALCMSIFAGCGNKDVATDVPVDNTVTDDSVVTPTDDTDSDTLIITTAGNVTPEAGVKNVVIEADGVILENATLDSVTISPKLGDGTATLNNVKVKTLDANGGGEHSLIINDCEVVTLVANREEGKLHITISVGSTVKTFTISSEVLADIEGAVNNLVVEDTATDPEVNILATSRVKDMLIKALTEIMIDAKVDSVSVTGDAKGSKIEVTKDGKLTKLSTDVPVTTSGEGKIDELVTDDPDNLDGDLKPNETTVNPNPLGNNGAKPTPTKTPDGGKTNPGKKPAPSASPTATPTQTPTDPVNPPKPVDPPKPPALGTKASLAVDNITIVLSDTTPVGITSGTQEIVDGSTLISVIMAGLSTRDNATYKIVAAGTTCTDAATYNALTAKKGTDKFATGDHIYVLSEDGKDLRNHSITAGIAKTLIDNSWVITTPDVEYTGVTAKPVFTLKKDATSPALTVGTDYELLVNVGPSITEPQDAINVGTIKVAIDGNGTYCGTVWKDIKITPKAITIAAAAKSCDDKVFDGNTNVTATNLDVTLDGVVGPALVKGTDYTVTGTFENANVGADKKINVAVTMLNTKAAKNFTLAEKTKLVTSTAAITPKTVVNKANATTASVTYNASGIDLSTYFTPDTHAGAASYEAVATQTDGGVGSVAGSTLTVTTCGKFNVTMKTAASADGNYASDTTGVSFVLTVDKTAGAAIAETLETVKTTAIGGTDGKITGLDAAKKYEYKKDAGAYANVADSATEITGLLAGTYTVRYQATNTVAAGIEKTITVADPLKSVVSLAKMAQIAPVLGKTVSQLQEDNVAFALTDKTFKATGSINEIITPWTEFEDKNNTGYFMAFEVNGATSTTTFVLHNKGTGGDKTVDLNVDNEIVFNLGADAGVHKTITFEVDLDGAGLDYENTTYTVNTDDLQLLKAAKLTINNKLDDIAADNTDITLKKNNAGSPIVTTKNGTGIYEATGLMNGTYHIWDDGKDTGKSVVVNGVDTAFDLNYYTVKLTGSGYPVATLKASANGVDIPTTTTVLGGTKITLTATVTTTPPNTVFGYTFKNGANDIAKQATDAENTRTFALNAKLDATVEITICTSIKEVTDLTVTAPVKFAVPAVATTTSENYIVNSTTWKAGDTEENAKFTPNTQYTATVELFAKPDSSFDDVAPTGSTLNGGTVVSHSISGATTGNHLTVVISYPKTAKAVLPTIDQPVIIGDVKVGVTLSATTPNYVGNDGGLNKSYTYRWFSKAADPTVPSGEVPRYLGGEATYTVVKDDINTIIFVTVVPVGTDNGLSGEPNTSEGTVTVPKVDPSNSAVAATPSQAYAGTMINVATLFNIEADLAASATYAIEAGSTGNGNIDGATLTVTGLGDIIISASTAATPTYNAKKVSCTLTVTEGAAKAIPTAQSAGHDTQAKTTVISALAADKTYEYVLDKANTTPTVWTGATELTGKTTYDVACSDSTYIHIREKFDAALFAASAVQNLAIITGEAVAVTAVNTAADAATTKTALETKASALGLDLTAYNTRNTANKTAIATKVFDGKADGYANAAAIKTVFDDEVTAKKSVITGPTGITPLNQSANTNTVPKTAISLVGTVETTNGGTLKYQWYSNIANSNIGGTPIADANAATYKPAADVDGGIVYYYCEISDDNGADKVLSAVSEVSTAVTMPTIIAINPLNLAGLVKPVTGATSQSVSNLSTTSKEFTIKSLSYNGITTPGTDKYAVGVAYNATITLTPNDGYMFTEGTPSMACTIGEVISKGTITEKDFTFTVNYKETEKLNQAAPGAPTISGTAVPTADTITLVAPEATGSFQYAKANTNSSETLTWQDSLVFTGLTAKTEYFFFARKKGDAEHNDSPASVSVAATTATAAP